ncbi:MAG: nucleoside triphosphate pyrophosphohydrolase [Flavobacteriaceae bacterium]|nr:nucleoside triphosphate pyrophosphohydrolase [Flavobacteriaceae bacterium]|tara:strand:+ start:3712 stop:4485 length:774 start_codon:yes stop_codon:yes gene_type:complete
MSKEKQLKSIGRLLEIMDDLREKCPWDKKQTFESLKSLTIEETYELVDAISENNIEEIKNELGDLLLHVIFYSRIASESNKFDISDVANSISKKLIFRHPHIYKEVEEINESEVKLNWEKLKLKDGRESILEGVPKSLPSILKSMRIQQKVSNVGFDWKDESQVKNKILEELKELSNELKTGNLKKIENEFGDLIFSVINFGRYIGINPDSALEKTNKKFIKKFKILENKMKSENKNIQNSSLTDLNKYWDLVKEKY